jgi:hypothetical protein
MFALPMPASWDLDNLLIEVLWSPATGAAGQVKWLVNVALNSDQDSPPAAWTSEDTVNDSCPATAHAMCITSAVDTGTLSGAAAGDVLHILVQRDAAHGDDTLTADAILRGIRLRYGVDAGSDD